MKIINYFTGLGLLLSMATTGFAQLTDPNTAREDQLAQILTSLTSARPDTNGNTIPLLSFDESGIVRHLGAPSGSVFPVGAARVERRPDLTARNFLKQYGVLLGAGSDAMDYQTLRTREKKGGHHVRLEQTYLGIPIFAAQALVQMDASSDIQSILADLPAEIEALENNRVPLIPVLTEAQAGEATRSHLSSLLARGESIFVDPVRLTIFMPGVLDEPGSDRLVWELKAHCEDGVHVAHHVLVDARNGEIVRAWNMSCPALNRAILDMNNNSNNVPSLVRSEGGAASGINEADLAYQFIADVYNFYNNRHQRDSYDDAGAQIQATVRWCSAGCGCPCVNAFSGSANSPSTGMVFGNGYVTDDIVAHEFTHRVTQLESGLIYTNTSGAINESFSDLWGEFTDLSFSTLGNDAETVRWDLFEDQTGSGGGAFRDMEDPTLFNDPDRVNSSLYQPPSNTSDNGGVHSNSGVNNKLAYLLTDGDTFNGQTVYGMGITRVADLYYEVQTALLTPAANWNDLANALRQAAINLGWSVEDQNNVYRGCLAVEIVAPRDRYIDFAAISCIPHTGIQICVPGAGAPYFNVNQGVDNMTAGDRLFIRGGFYHEAVVFDKVTTVRSYLGSVQIGTP